MNPIEFPGQTVTLRRPDDMTDEQCGPLPIRRESGTCISCWQMDWRERFKALFTGRIWVGVLSGISQPPIYAAVDQPFQDHLADLAEKNCSCHEEAINPS